MVGDTWREPRVLLFLRRVSALALFRACGTRRLQDHISVTASPAEKFVAKSGLDKRRLAWDKRGKSLL